MSVEHKPTSPTCTTPGAGDYLVWSSGSVEGSAGGSTQNVSLYVNGVQLAHGERQVFTEAYL